MTALQGRVRGESGKPGRGERGDADRWDHQEESQLAAGAKKNQPVEA